MKRANPEAMLVVMLASDGSVFMRQYRELGLTQKLYARGSMATAEFLHQVRDNPTSATASSRPRTGRPGSTRSGRSSGSSAGRCPPRVHGSLAAIALQVRGGAGHRDGAQEDGEGRPQDDPDALEEVDVKDTPLGPIKFDDTTRRGSTWS